MKKIFLASVTIFLLISCNRVEDINSLINSINNLPTVANSNIVHPGDTTTFEIIDGVKYVCTAKSATISRTLDEIVILNPNIGSLYPGSVIKVKSLKNGILEPISIKRNGGRLTIENINSINNDSALTTIHVNEATYEEYIRAYGKLTNRTTYGQQVARLTFEQDVSHQLEETLLKFGMSASYMNATTKAQLERSFTSNKSKYFVKIVQPYFDISFQTDFKQKQNPSDFFGSKIYSNDLYKAMGDTANNPLAYNKSVTYGRILLLFIESEDSQRDLYTGLEAALSSLKSKVNLNLSSEQMNAIENSKINMLALGGSTKSVIKLLSGNKLESLITYLNDGANFSEESPAFPISYKANYLKNDETARLSFTTNYVVKDCKKDIRKITRIDVSFINIIDNKDKDEGITFTVYKGNRIIGQQLNIGINVNWTKNSNGGWNIPIADGQAYESDRDLIRVNISKNGNKGFHCKPTVITVLFNDGSSEEWLRLDGDFIMGKKHSNNQTFSLKR